MFQDRKTNRINKYIAFNNCNDAILSYVRLAIRYVIFPAHSENALISFPTREKKNTKAFQVMCIHEPQSVWFLLQYFLKKNAPNLKYRIFL